MACFCRAGDYARNLIRFKARQLSRRRDFRSDEPDDLRQELWLALVKAAARRLREPCSRRTRPASGGGGRGLARRARVGADLRPITITGGHKATPGKGCGWLVPKKELVGTLQVLLQGRRLHVARHLPESQTLIKELIQFQVKVTAAANETFGNWREGIHDDLVVTVALAAWAGENIGIGRLEIWV